MNPLQRALIEKAGHDHGFEYVIAVGEDYVRLASARHPAQVSVAYEPNLFGLTFTSAASALLQSELTRTFPGLHRSEGSFVAPDMDALAGLLRRAAELAHALPNQAAHDFDTALANELAGLPSALRGTEVERLVRQRVGQQAFRSAMMDYWGGSCAVSGIALPALLRASHAKPWADCATDAERLDVFNGFMLSANLDALFDSFLISFADTGELLTSERIPAAVAHQLGFDQGLRLRWLAPEHLPYLRYHRERFGEITDAIA